MPRQEGEGRRGRRQLFPGSGGGGPFAYWVSSLPSAEWMIALMEGLWVLMSVSALNIDAMNARERARRCWNEATQRKGATGPEGWSVPVSVSAPALFFRIGPI
mmetsp:Transcript_53712/g.105032  ORF Transcript_53712/g.105032 Transcript_53712/m.105032 type:complete len:103 (+) Transcript_53712:790-1098(+)